MGCLHSGRHGQRLAGRFAFDWSGWTRGAYEYRTLALDAASTVLNSGGGTMNLQNGAPSISKSNDLIGGAGRVVMDTDGRLNFTEQGAAKTISGYNPVLKQNNGLWKPGYSSLAYDANGHLKSATDAGRDGTLNTADDIRLDYVANAQGLVLRRNQVYGTTVAKTHQYLYLDGQGIGDIGNDGDTQQDYAQRLAQPRQTKEQTYKNWTPIDSADFDQNWQPIGPEYPGATPGSYMIKAGDTLQGIAAAQWGDGSLWYLIADANGLTGTTPLTAGQVLTLPNKVTNVHNNAQTWRPYDAGRVIGDTSPTLPDAPPAPPVYSGKKKKKGCGGVGGIIVAIVVVVATVYTAGAASIAMAGGSVAGTGFAGTMAAGVSAMGSMTAAGFAAAAIGGAVGSIAGQGLSMAMGLQEKFSWGAVAAGALGAALGGAAYGAAGGGIAGVAAANVASQGINLLTGQQREFSWASLAASVISAPIASSLSGSLLGPGGAFAGASSVQAALVSSTTRALVSAVTRLTLEGGRLRWESVAADALSGAIQSAYASDGNGAGKETPRARMAREEAGFDLGAIGSGAQGDTAYDTEMLRLHRMAASELGNGRVQPASTSNVGLASNNDRSFISNPYVEIINGAGGEHWSSGVDTYPVHMAAIEMRPLAAVGTLGDGSLVNAIPGLGWQRPGMDIAQQTPAAERMLDVATGVVRDVLYRAQAFGPAEGAMLTIAGSVRKGFSLAEDVGMLSGSGSGVGANSANPAGRLRFLGNETWESPLGLQYGPDAQYGNRIQHILRHAEDQPLRAGEYGVFDAGRRGAVGVVDEAWAIAQQGGSNVTATTVGSKTVYTVDMGRRVGWVGGQGGAALGNPGVSNIQLVIRNWNQAITAYPIR